MTSPEGHGWAITLADLAIILFMLTAADLANSGGPAPAASASVATAEPIAVYRPGNGAPPLAAWLASQPDDPRQQLTILVRHDGRGDDDAIAQGLALSAQAGAAGRAARLIIEHSDRDEVAATLGYDADPDAVARKLLEAERRSLTPEDLR
ncbi:MAG: hypothetical protein B7Z08_02030 [Sphingomonadales bacterium 32-68-7]|nr:MAG: hypothetical protein B7Z33_10525 [Sphingomonadales bacterium 12-68-11]OYX10156.1 MAG: hypothetical protein B7Z08_02030 [Sphingomonadales bacterium 32-68-7]